MKKYISTILIALASFTATHAQTAVEGKCGDNVVWSFDGSTLSIDVAKGTFSNPMQDYDTKRNISPWRKKKMKVKVVRVGKGVTSIGSCAFAGCKDLTEVFFDGTDVVSIGWGAFMDCTSLKSVSLPTRLRDIGAVAFANCRSMDMVKIPAQCKVGDQAFVSCNNLTSIDCATTAVLGQMVFAREVPVGNSKQHVMYTSDIIRIPPYINVNNCQTYGLAKEVVEKVTEDRMDNTNYDEITSVLDKDIPKTGNTRNNTYVLIIGNEKYRFATNVTYAIHDARVFREYCEMTLGIPAVNIHSAENATKQMIMEQELEDWLGNLQNRDNKRLIIYYAGHGVPDTKDKNKSYLLPTDVRGENPKRGIALDDFYNKIGGLEFAQATIFLDACFSGVNRGNGGVTEGTRGVEIDVEETPVNNGRLIVFSAAQGNETAQGYPEQGHGLFTYYLLKEIRETGGDVSFGTLSDNIRNGVTVTSQSLKLRKRQTPTTSASENFADIWRSLSF